MKACVGNALILSMIAGASWFFGVALNVAIEKNLYQQPSIEQLRQQRKVIARWDDNEYVSLMATYKKR